MSEPTVPGGPSLSVVIATYNRRESLVRLLGDLAEQSLAADAYEVIVVDDGSSPAATPRIKQLALPYALLVLTQVNAGQAAARHLGLLHAAGDVVVIVDDDMRVGATFLDEHRRAHAAARPRVVLGALHAEQGVRLSLFERWQLASMAKREREVRAGRMQLRGTHLYTGNVSFRREDYFAVGGFDTRFRLSEDAELGVRFELAGLSLIFGGGPARHASDHTSLPNWMRRSRAYGAADSRVSDKHAGISWTNPWRYLFTMHPLTRLPMLISALVPWMMRPVAWLAVFISLGVARLGAERLAIKGTTFVYGLQYFAGVHDHHRTLRRAASGLLEYARQTQAKPIATLALKKSPWLQRRAARFGRDTD